MEHGTVMNYIQDHGHTNVDKLVSFCLIGVTSVSNKLIKLYEIAQGLQYLHSRNIVHGDLRGVHGF
jgi:serine/threonine protein kinase